ncbi:hypothetical protein B0H15DRAFT_1022194 [Mycena belliarum]|uniref:Uncharacterized protein n=1 Tax=Mycena belliarum TaxID=1033014 RepID=A0AAD6U4S0_9AGAR|nr:hypothetical protein B0H15DRAFT_1022194 [Mycena belliae]
MAEGVEQALLQLILGHRDIHALIRFRGNRALDHRLNRAVSLDLPSTHAAAAPALDRTHPRHPPPRCKRVLEDSTACSPVNSARTPPHSSRDSPLHPPLQPTGPAHDTVAAASNRRRRSQDEHERATRLVRRVRSWPHWPHKPCPPPLSSSHPRSRRPPPFVPALRTPTPPTPRFPPAPTRPHRRCAAQTHGPTSCEDAGPRDEHGAWRRSPPSAVLRAASPHTPLCPSHPRPASESRAPPYRTDLRTSASLVPRRFSLTRLLTYLGPVFRRPQAQHGRGMLGEAVHAVPRPPFARAPSAVPSRAGSGSPPNERARGARERRRRPTPQSTASDCARAPRGAEYARLGLPDTLYGALVLLPALYPPTN